jgi:hypothetical protein
MLFAWALLLWFRSTVWLAKMLSGGKTVLRVPLLQDSELLPKSQIFQK